MIRFWDSSALIQIYVDQVDSDLARRVYEEDEPVVVWWGSQVECVRAFCALAARDEISIQTRDLLLATLGDDWNSWLEIEPSDSVRKLANEMVRRHLLKAADGLQLGAALSAARGAGGEMEVVCFDKALAQAAAAEGLAVLGRVAAP